MGDSDGGGGVVQLLVIVLLACFFGLALYYSCALRDPPPFVAKILRKLDQGWESRCHPGSTGAPETPRTPPKCHTLEGAIVLTGAEPVSRTASSADECCAACSEDGHAYSNFAAPGTCVCV